MKLEIKELTTEECIRLMKEMECSPGFAIIDVRRPEEYARGHLKGSINIDFSSPGFLENLGKMERSGVYLVYCARGNRSRRACEAMSSAGFPEVYSMAGGLLQWVREAGPAVEKDEDRCRG